MEKHRDERGFTLMELMVVIVIVAILAAVAVPLYVNYVKDAQRTEAKGAIGAIVSAQQVHYQRTGGTGTATYASLDDLILAKEVDLTEAQINWTFTTSNEDVNGYTIKATRNGVDPQDTSLDVTYTFTRTGGGAFAP
ncbi:MAG: prepilin-type N-terminal cleavage/methylation domain-containing protein [Candidatus Eisenbacteria bacterium]